MAAREQAQHTREKKGGSNPGKFSPDDDEAQEADVTHAGESAVQGEQRQAQEDGRRRPEENIEQIDEEDDEGEEPDRLTDRS